MRILRAIIAAVVVLLMAASPALAAHIVLSPLKDAGLDFVVVWRDSESMSRFYSLQSAKALNADNMNSLAMPLIACIVQPGTKGIITDHGFFNSNIMIVEGPNQGCSGYLPNRYFTFVLDESDRMMDQK